MDEHEALIEYSEMTSFDFNSKEFQEVRRDYIECKNAAAGIMRFVMNVLGIVKTVKELLMSRKEYNNKCFLPNWLEVDLAEVSDHQLNKEERLESKRRKDLNTLLKELDEISKTLKKLQKSSTVWQT